ncbi:Na(+)/H(+) antiporter subunit D [Parahaliea aestuarii]|uniref:Na(+)/H(+) antiporter subunit D n=1 Tax=Parahaliea aestuarii TaxID=1852021 RepID=A0A5C8ZYQ6_9GAMM|nr:Na(+)/H(+) antiporter subunit D [Parahaliea aestuarii]TXS92381.1 Na(+)/H(+) antiporter subunit D [Parahaliea aestuarii]
MIALPPFALFYLAALAVALTRGRVRSVVLVATPLLGALNLWTLPTDAALTQSLFSLQLEWLRIDRLSLLFGYLFHIAALIALIYALHVRDTLQQVSALLYAGSALGAVFAGDLLTFFLFWEGMALTSVCLVWARRSPASYSAGVRYLVIQIISGLLLFTGLIMLWRETGSLAFSYIGTDATYGWLILLALGLKAAFPLLHSWLVDAYPEATPTGTVFLSAFTTKVAIYALTRGFPGTELLVYVGATMACFPIFFAVVENDLRRVLAYSLINQLGFMVVGIGIGSQLAINGAVAHAFTDVIFKGLLFMSMGAVLTMTGRVNGSELGGLYKTMPRTTVLCIVGAASISAFPLFSGFVSKSMIMSAALKEEFFGVWLLLLFASAGVFHHAGIKIPYFAFFAHDSGIRVSDPPGNMQLAMLIAAVLCIAIGVYPQLLYDALPFDVTYTPYDVTHVLTQMQLLLFSALAFVWLNRRGLYPPELNAVHLDFDWTYRRLLPQAALPLIAAIVTVDRRLRQFALQRLQQVIGLARQLHSPGGVLSRDVGTGTMVLWVTLLLAVYLFLSFT